MVHKNRGEVCAGTQDNAYSSPQVSFPFILLYHFFYTATQLTEGLEEANSKLTIFGQFSTDKRRRNAIFDAVSTGIDVRNKTDLIKITWSR